MTKLQNFKQNYRRLYDVILNQYVDVVLEKLGPNVDLEFAEREAEKLLEREWEALNI